MGWGFGKGLMGNPCGEGDSPPPLSPPLVAIATTVHYMGTCPLKDLILRFQDVLAGLISDR